MNELERIQKLMESGWDIRIECKGKGRTYEMTYEANATQVIQEHMTAKEKNVSMMRQAHAVGKTMAELIGKMEEQVGRY